MLESKHALVTAVLVSLPVVGGAQDVDDVLDRMIAAENAGYRDVDNYTVKSETMGYSTMEYYEKTSAITLDNGQTVYIMRSVPPGEIQERQSGSAFGDATPGDLRLAAMQVEEAGRQMDAGLQNEMQKAGLSGGLGSMVTAPNPDQPWLSANPRDMTSMYATMLNASAEAKERAAAEQGTSAADYQRNIEAIRHKTRVTGRRLFNGIDAIELAANDIDYAQQSEGQQFELKTMQMLVDAEKYVPLYLKLDGTVTDGNGSRPITIEREDSDYRTVAGCGDLYEPFATVMRLGGAMTPEQQAQLKANESKLAELEQQLANMPASQRQMMESMMGPQLEMIRNMASGGGIEIKSTIRELRCNAGLPSITELAQTGPPGMAGAAAAMPASPAPKPAHAPEDDTEMVRRIQVSLAELGYGPGNTDGVMDKGTAIAISRFEANRGLNVTGRPSWELAGMLGRAVEDGAFRADQ